MKISIGENFPNYGIKIIVVRVYVFLRVQQEVTGSHLTMSQNLNVVVLCIATAGHYISEPTDTASEGIGSRLKEALLESVVQNEIVK